MGNRTWKGMTIKLDNTVGSLVDLTAYCNSVDLGGSQEMIDDTSLNDEEHSYVFGLAGAGFTANFFSNSTTDPIFTPLLGNRTTATKTARVYNGNKWFCGETLVGDVGFSGAPGALQVWGASFTFDGVIANTTT